MHDIAKTTLHTALAFGAGVMVLSVLGLLGWT
jgi:hypothetical protein